MTSRPLAQLAVVALLALASTASAQKLLWAGAAGNAATAGDGNWDENTSATWRDNSPSGPLVRWSQHRLAIFRGSAGGAVRMLGSMTTDGIQFEKSSGPFTLHAAGELTIGGAGISCEAATRQTLEIRGAILRFTDRASAAAGSQSDHVRLVSDGLVIFAGASTASRAQIENSGDLQFTETSSAGTATIVSSGQLTFSGSATAGRAIITNDGLMSWENKAASGAAALTNRGQLRLAGEALHLEALAISNQENGLIDLSSQTSALRIASLTNGENAAIHLGRAPLQLANLHLVAGNSLTFHLGADGTSPVKITASLLTTLSLGGTAISVLEDGAAPTPRTVTLLDWSAAAVVLGIDAEQFVLQELPPGRTGRLRIVDRQLFLDLQPAPSRPGE